MRSSSGYLRNAALAAADILALALAWALALWGYWVIGLGHYALGWTFYLRLWPLAGAYVFVNAFSRLYHGNAFSPAAPVAPPEELRRLACSAAFVHFGLMAALALAFQTTVGYSRAVVVIAGVLTALLTQPMRDGMRGLLKRFHVGQVPVRVLGKPADVMRFSRFFMRDAHWGFEHVETGRKVDIAVVCGAEGEDIAKTMSKYTHIIYFPKATLLPVGGARTVTVGGCGGIAFVNRLRMRPLRWQKEVMDKTIAIFAFIALTPVFLIVSFLVRLTSRGPVFYRQQRLGKNGTTIRVWKFRTMYEDADVRLAALLESDQLKRREWELNFKLSDDPRVTPFGRFLRHTSLDELPQLFNVLCGEMALVGPRPIVEREVPMYGNDYTTFSSVKPGMTGLWQVSGRSDTDYDRRVALDVHYILNWSPWMDVWILIRTVYAVLFMRGAR